MLLKGSKRNYEVGLTFVVRRIWGKTCICCTQKFRISLAGSLEHERLGWQVIYVGLKVPLLSAVSAMMGSRINDGLFAEYMGIKMDHIVDSQGSMRVYECAIQKQGLVVYSMSP